MKKIIILIAAIFLHLNVYSNTFSPCIDTNEELIEKLVNNEDLDKIYTASFGLKILRSSAYYNKKETGEVSNEIIDTFNKFNEKRTELLTKFKNENPELEKLSLAEKEEVLTKVYERKKSNLAAQLIVCLLTAGGGCATFERLSKFKKVAWAACIAASLIADTVLAVTQPELIPGALEEELTGCMERVDAQNGITCITGALTGFVACAWNYLS